MTHRQGNNGYSSRLRGVGLVEVMIAMVIGLTLSAAAGTVFVNSNETSSIQMNLGRLQENGRYAINLVTKDLRRAGFWNGVYKMSNIEGSENKITPDGSCVAADTTWARMVERQIYGLNNTRTGYACIPATEYVRGDVLVVRYAAPEQTAAFVDDTLYMRSSPLFGRIFTGDNEAQSANDVSGAGDSATRISALTAHAFFVGNSSDNCNGVSIPALYWKTLDDAGSPESEELVTGVEYLEVQYAVDTDGDMTIDQYLNSDTIDTEAAYDWDQVIAARVWVLIRAECTEAGFTDGRTYSMGDQNYTPADSYRRQLYSSVVMLRN